MGYSDKAPETIRSIGDAHEIAEKLGNTRLRASVLRLYGGIELQRGNYDSATSMTREALRLSQLLKDKHRTAHCLLLLGKLATGQAYFDDAIRYEEESLQIFRDLNDHNCSMLSYFSLGWNVYLAGESSQAIEHMQESLSIAREIDVKNAIVMPLLALGSISVSRSEILQAKGFLLGALEALKVSPDWTYWLAYSLEAVCAIPSIPPNKAARLLGKAAAIREKEVFVIPISEQHLVEPIIEKIQSQLGKEAFHSEQATGMELTFQQAVEAAIEVLQSLE
jgi:tetratricopeptide (TPR) repeat protein